MSNGQKWHYARNIQNSLHSSGGGGGEYGYKIYVIDILGGSLLA